MRTTLLLASLFLSPTALATEIGPRPFGLGILLGAPTGLSGKYYLGSRMHAIDAALAWNTWGLGTGGYVHATYLIHPGPLYDHPAFTLPWHFGGGGFVASGWDKNGSGGAIGGRAAIGLDMDFHDYPLQVFGDVALVVPILPAIDVGLSITIGARYYF